MNKYEVIIYWSHDDQSYVAEIPELAGCVADGRAAREALQNVEIIANKWIEIATELGRNIPTPKG